MKRHLWIPTAVLMCLLLAALAFAFTGPPSLLLPRRDDSSAYLIGMSQANLVEPWRVSMNLEFKEASAEHEDLRVIYTDAAQDTQRQIRDVKMLMGYGIDLLVISPNDSELLSPVISEVCEKIPVIVLDRAVTGDNYTLFIGPDNEQIGYLAGQRVNEMLDGAGTVVEIIGTKDSPPVSARMEGFERALREENRVTVADRLVGNWLQDQAQDRFKEYLVMEDFVPDVVFAQNDAMAYGAYLAADSLRVSGIRFIGIDGLEGDGGGVDLVRRGVLDTTIYCPTGGRQAVEYSLRILNGEKLDSKQVVLSAQRITGPIG